MKVFDKSITRSLVNTLLPLLLTAFATQVHAASMNDYCVMPPYVRTNVKPNIMIMMDNAVDMGEPAYTLGYDPATPYSGYYKKGLKYSYASGRWQPDVNGIYSGNLLNWVTTSKYDLLEGILVGGISTSRQSQINTLISKSNSWQKTLTYTNSLGQSRTCIFKINNANVEITEDTVGACGYLFDATYPPQPIPGDPRPSVSSLKPERQFAESFYPYAQHLPLNGVSSNL